LHQYYSYFSRWNAVQQANFRPSGTPMALAPGFNTVWQRFLRFDPDDPIWPNRDRSCCPTGMPRCCSMRLLHLTGVKAVDAKYETLGELSVKLDDIKKFRQLGSKCPGHPEYHLTSGVETTTGPAGAGLRQQRRHGARRPLARPAFQSARLPPVRLRCLCPLWGRRHDGGRVQRSGFVRGSPDARKICAGFTTTTA